MELSAEQKRRRCLIICISIVVIFAASGFIISQLLLQVQFLLFLHCTLLAKKLRRS